MVCWSKLEGTSEYIYFIHRSRKGSYLISSQTRKLRSSLEAEVDIIIPTSDSPKGDSQDDVLGVLRKHGKHASNYISLYTSLNWNSII